MNDRPEELAHLERIAQHSLYAAGINSTTVRYSFEIFRRFPVRFPVIFTTAFDKYLLESFEFNSIDYLLKPITEEKLKRSSRFFNPICEECCRLRFLRTMLLITKWSSLRSIST